jgi:hypothetical protein
MRSGRLIIAMVIALAALGSYFGKSTTNPLTGDEAGAGNRPRDEKRA